MQCKLFSQEDCEIFSDVVSITLSSKSGELQILSGYTESFLLLREGNLSVEMKGKQKKIKEIEGGMCWVKDDEVSIVL